MQKVLLISGRKQSGKTSAMNYLAGYLLTQAGLVINGHPISQFQLDEQGMKAEGKLYLNTVGGKDAYSVLKESPMMFGGVS
mgnify:CR=1 FL=1